MGKRVCFDFNGDPHLLAERIENFRSWLEDAKDLGRKDWVENNAME